MKQIRQTGVKNVNTEITNERIKKYRNDTRIQQLEFKLQFFADKLVQDIKAKRYYIKSSCDNSFDYEIHKADAINKAHIAWGDTKIQDENGTFHKITQTDIEVYFEFIERIDGQMHLPLCEPIVKKDGKLYYNPFKDQTIENNDPITEEEISYISQYLNLMAKGIFGIVDYDMDYHKFTDIVVNKNYPKRKEDNMASKEEIMCFFFEWLSAIYHRPGRNFATVPCFFGLQGTGKSTLSTIISNLIGNCNENLTQSNTTRFNAVFDGTLIAIYNEVKDIPGFYNDVIKPTSGSTKRNIERKGVDPVLTENITNLILLSNHLTPFKIDHDDRRLIVIQTLTAEQDITIKIKDKWASFLSGDEDWSSKIPQIFAKIMPQITFDTETLNRGQNYTTEAKELMAGNQKTPIERFFEDTTVPFIKLDEGTPSTQKKTSIEKLERLYKKWADNDDGLSNVGGNGNKTIFSFKNEVNSLAQSQKYVAKTKDRKLVFTDSFYDNWIAANPQIETTEKVVSLEDKFKARFNRLKGQ